MTVFHPNILNFNVQKNFENENLNARDDTLSYFNRRIYL